MTSRIRRDRKEGDEEGEAGEEKEDDISNEYGFVKETSMQ